MNETLKVKKRYNRTAFIREIYEFPLERLYYKKWRKEAFHALKGKVLEIGVGSGKSIPFYGNVDYIGIDISENELKIAKNRFPDKKLMLMDSQKLEFTDNTFDHVTSVNTMCSIPDPVKALMEMKRVLKPKGRIIMIEHVLSKNRLLAFFQHLHNPFTKYLLGFNVNRDTRANIEKAGLKIVEDKHLAVLDMFRKFVCEK